jgi:methionine synthase II (cobalamin-independent)
MTEHPEFALMPTGIGSLPYLEANKACRIVLDHFNETPFWPQLPKLGFQENMYAQFAYDLPGIQIDSEGKRISADSETKLSSEIDDFYNKLSADGLTYKKKYYSGLYSMLENKKELAEAEAVKGHITGPISLGMQIFNSTSGKPVIYDELYREIIVKALNNKIRIQENILKPVNERVIIFCDEPSLCLFGTPYLNLSRDEIVVTLTELFKDITCLKGVHCCGNPDWSIILELPIDIVSFDAYSYGERLILYAKEVKEFIARDKAIAFGIVPSVEDDFKVENLNSLVSKFDALLKKFIKKGISEKEILRNALITASCGLANLSIEYTEKNLRLTRELSEKLKERYGLRSGSIK